MWPFKKKKPNKATNPIPKEIKDYYESERRGRNGVAWLLALGTLVTTVVLALAIFFGGRWIYRKIRGTDSGSGTAQNQPKPSGSVSQSPNSHSGSKSGGASEIPGLPKKDQTSSASTDQPSRSANPNHHVHKSAVPTTLVNTGSGNIVGAFVITTLMGAAGYYLVNSRRVGRAN